MINVRCWYFGVFVKAGNVAISHVVSKDKDYVRSIRHRDSVLRWAPAGEFTDP